MSDTGCFGVMRLGKSFNTFVMSESVALSQGKRSLSTRTWGSQDVDGHPSPDYGAWPEAPPFHLFTYHNVPVAEYRSFYAPEDHVFQAEEQPLPAWRWMMRSALPRHPGMSAISRELVYGITDDVGMDTIMHGLMEDARDDRSELRGRVNLLYSDRPIHHHLAVMVEREAWMAREAWGFSMELIKRRLMFYVLALRYTTQMAEFQRQQGPAEGPAQPDAPEEAGSCS
ncbi:hypothetical protein Tco_0356912 [Tanacetum coccineum]